MESDTSLETETENENDSDWLSEAGPLKWRTEGKKRRKKMVTGRRKSSGALTPRAIASSDSESKDQRKDIRGKDQIPVTCGTKSGILHKKKYNNGKPCIFSGHQWFTPCEFEKFGGREKTKKWKTSILYDDIPLQMLIEDGLLSSPSFKLKRMQNKKHDFLEDSPVTSKKQAELGKRRLFKVCRRSGDRKSKDDHTSEFISTSESSSESSSSKKDDNEDWLNDSRFQDDTFGVTCFKGKGVLHLYRFAKAHCGKCIRTHQAWLTPLQFLDQNRPNGNWRRDIKCYGVPIGDLIMNSVLELHGVNCRCSVCTGDSLHLLYQKNDDVCFNCDSEGDLVCCVKCPRAFHHTCHYPVLQDDTSDQWTCSYCLKLRNRN